MQFEGIYTPFTPFRDDQSIDFDAWGRVVDWQADNGVHGIIVGGSTGEFFSLTQEERVEQFNFAVERVAGRLPLISARDTHHSSAGHPPLSGKFPAWVSHDYCHKAETGTAQRFLSKGIVWFPR